MMLRARSANLGGKEGAEHSVCLVACRACLWMVTQAEGVGMGALKPSPHLSVPRVSSLFQSAGPKLATITVLADPPRES